MKEMKKYFILILTVFILLLLSIKQYSFDVSVKVDKQTYDKGATIKITSAENMKKVKLYIYFLFYYIN